MHRSLFLLFTIITFLACGQEKSNSKSPKSLEEIIQIASNTENIQCFIVSKDDKTIVEKYFKRYDNDSLDHLRSATKSVMSILIGIAIDKGIIKSLNDPITKYLNEVPDNKKEIKILNLLSMTSGLKWSEGEGYNDNNRMMDSGNPYKFLMDLPLAHKPSKRWNYSTGDIHLLSVILSNATGMSTAKFAEMYLFKPLSIDHFEWQILDDKYYAGGSRLQLKPLDMLKIGQMMANDGIYKGQHILSKDYIEKSTSNLVLFDDTKKIQEGYGFGWWTITVDNIKAYMASGYAGQTIAVIPKKGLVIVTTFNWVVNGQSALDQQNKVQKLAKMVWDWSDTLYKRQ